MPCQILRPQLLGAILHPLHQYHNRLYLLLRIRLRDLREADEDRNLLRLHRTVHYDQKGPPPTGYYPSQQGLGLGQRRHRHLFPWQQLKQELYQPRLHRQQETRSPRSRQRISLHINQTEDFINKLHKHVEGSHFQASTRNTLEFMRSPIQYSRIRMDEILQKLPKQDASEALSDARGRYKRFFDPISIAVGVGSSILGWVFDFF